MLDVHGAGFDDQAFGYQLDNSAKTLSFYGQGVLAHHDGGNDTTLGAAISQRDPRTGENVWAEFNAERGTFVDNPAQARRALVAAAIITQRVTLVAGWKAIGPEYNPVDGYVPLNDIRGPLLLATLNETGRGALKSWNVTGYADRYIDGSGAVHESATIGSATATFKNLLSRQLGDAERLPARVRRAVSGLCEPARLALRAELDLARLPRRHAVAAGRELQRRAVRDPVRRVRVGARLLRERDRAVRARVPAAAHALRFPEHRARRTRSAPSSTARASARSRASPTGSSCAGSR